MYKAIRFFTDLQDNNHAYHEGDTFPREGLKVSDQRLAELSGKGNRRGMPLIKEVEFMNPPTPKEEPKAKRTRRKG